MRAVHASSFLDPTALLTAVGPWALVIVIVFLFIENGLFFPFLPGDSLVFAAAILVAKIGIPLWLLIVIVAVTVALGSQTSFIIGRRFGNRLFKPDAKIFKTKYHDQADAFLVKYGAPSLVLARFVPIVRTFVSPIAGTSQMRKRVFTVWNIIGAIIWAVLLCLAGFFLGKIPAIANNIELIAVALVVLSVLPIVIGGIVRSRKSHREAKATADAQA